MSHEPVVPLNKWQKEVLKSLKSIWSSNHDCKKVHADFILKNDGGNVDGESTLWYLNISPVTQEIVGGFEDGAKKNSCFQMNIFRLYSMSDWTIHSEMIISSCSFCKNLNKIPKIILSTSFKHKPLEITIYLSPVHDTIENTICMHQKNR